MLQFLDKCVRSAAEFLDAGEFLTRFGAALMMAQSVLVSVAIIVLFGFPFGCLLFTDLQGVRGVVWLISILLFALGLFLATFHVKFTHLRAKAVKELPDEPLRVLAIGERYIRWSGESFAIVWMGYALGDRLVALLLTFGVVPGNLFSVLPVSRSMAMDPMVGGLLIWLVSIPIMLLLHLVLSVTVIFFCNVIAAFIRGYIVMCSSSAETAGLLRQLPKAIAYQVSANSTGGQP
jgi:hypothetical protein